jgi:hypothetical protein
MNEPANETNRLSHSNRKLRDLSARALGRNLDVTM